MVDINDERVIVLSAKENSIDKSALMERMQMREKKFNLLETKYSNDYESALINYAKEIESLNAKDEADLKDTLNLFLNLFSNKNKQYNIVNLSKDEVIKKLLTISFDQNPESLNNRLKTLKADKDNKYVFAIDVSNGISDDFVSSLLETLASYKDKNLNLIVYTNREGANDKINYLFSAKEFETLAKINNFLLSCPCKKGLKILDTFGSISYDNSFNEIWDYNVLSDANNYISKIVDIVKNNHLSPAESVYYIHKAVSLFRYKESESDSLGSQTIVGAFSESGEIVCAGFSSMIKAIIDTLNMDGLTCEFAPCTLINKITYSKLGTHVNIRFSVEDKKYDINGSFISDVTWDSGSLEHPYGRGFAHCLYPISDSLHINKGYYIKNENYLRSEQIITSLDDLEISIKSMKKQNLLDKIKNKIITFNKTINLIKETKNEVLNEKTEVIPIDKVRKILTYLDNNIKSESKVRYFDPDLEIFNSIMFAQKVFDKNAASCFITEKNFYKDTAER